MTKVWRRAPGWHSRAFPRNYTRTPLSGARAALHFGRRVASYGTTCNSPSVESRYRLNWLIASGESRRRQTRVFAGLRRAYYNVVDFHARAPVLHHGTASIVILLFTSIFMPFETRRIRYFLPPSCPCLVCFTFENEILFSVKFLLGQKYGHRSSYSKRLCIQFGQAAIYDVLSAETNENSFSTAVNTYVSLKRIENKNHL